MQILVNGIISGCAIALLAVAFQVVYLPTRVFFLGLGGVYAAAPFLAHGVLTHGGSGLLAVSAAILASVGLALLCEWANHAPLKRRQASSGAHLIASLGIYILIVQIVTMTWGNDTKVLRIGLDQVGHFAGVTVTGAQGVSLVVAVLLLLCFGLLLMSSNWGLCLRALADNPIRFALLGYDVTRYRLIAFGLAGFFAAVAALVSAYDIGFDPQTGLDAILLAVVAVIIGGQGSFTGPVLGSFLLGILRAQVVWHWSARWQQPFTFGLLALVLILRPQGLLGSKTRLEASP